jgi:hypothetical protein
MFKMNFTWTHLLWRLCIRLSLAFLLLPAGALGYPVLLNSSQLSTIFGTPRNQLIALRSDGTQSLRVPLQIDEVEDDAALVLREPYEVRKLRASLPHPQKRDPFFGRMQSVHRIVLDDRDFSDCNAECKSKLPAQIKTICRSTVASVLLEVSLGESRKSLFIADCGSPVAELPPRDIKYNSESKTISTQKYEYVHTSDKNIFFSEIRARPETRPVMAQSELKAYLKPKYLFNMKFEDDDLTSQITSLSRGSQALNIEVAVALNILAMKINTQICCDVSFYEDALYFPVVLDLPFSGQSFAKGSGLFFGFQSDTQSKTKTEFIPSQTADESDAILIHQEGNLIALGFRSPNKKQSALVKPKIVSSADMEKLKFTKLRSPSGIFYDIQAAQEGFQHFMVWVYFGKESEKAKLTEYAQRGARVRVEKFTSPAGP